MKDNKENTSGKSPWRWVFLACAALGAVELVGSLAAYVLAYLFAVKSMAPSKAASIGIIGGADGPTAIFVTTPGWTAYIVPVLLLVVGIGGWILLSRQKGSNITS